MGSAVIRIAASLFSAGSVLAADLGPQLLAAARSGENRRVAELVAKGAPVGATDKNGRTPLMLAAEKGHADIIRFLLEQGASVDARDRQGWTAFGLALFSSSGSRNETLRALPHPPKLRLAVDSKWTPENLYSSCLMAPSQLNEHVAALQPEMVALGILRDTASISAMGLVELSTGESGDAALSMRVRPGASCVAQQSSDNLSLAIDARLIRLSDKAVLHDKTYGGGLKGLHARTVTSPAQYAKLYADWAAQHSKAIYWAVVETGASHSNSISF